MIELLISNDIVDIGDIFGEKIE